MGMRGSQTKYTQEYRARPGMKERINAQRRALRIERGGKADTWGAYIPEERLQMPGEGYKHVSCGRDCVDCTLSCAVTCDRFPLFVCLGCPCLSR